MAYCSTHSTNNCLECAIEKQTESIVRAIHGLKAQTIQIPVPRRTLKEILRSWLR